MVPLWTKWIVAALFLLAGLSSLGDVRKHGQPRRPYDGYTSAWSAIFAFLIVLWLIAVVP